MDESTTISAAGESVEAMPIVPMHAGVQSSPHEREATGRAVPAGPGSGRWLGLLVCLAIVAAAPYLIGQVVYQVRFNELKAGTDVASEALTDLKPRLSDFEMASRLVAKRLEPSVVSIFRPGIGGLDGQGSGVIVDAQGYIVTNFHVVRGATSIEVHLSDGRRANVSDVWTDEATDLAVLKIDLPNLVAAQWGDSDELEVGDLVWAVGSPFGLDRSITFGIVSAKDRRSSSGLTRYPYQEYLQTDAAVNPGNSGGPLINIEGRVVGINAAIFGTAYQGISFAIPSNVAHEQYEQLRAKGYVERAFLGISPLAVPPSIQERLGLEIGQGVLVGEVRQQTPADRAGIQVGDVILKWNDFTATDPTLLSRAIASTRIGSTAKVRLIRAEQGDGQRESQPKELELLVQVERRPLRTSDTDSEP
jgi:serine protease Do